MSGPITPYFWQACGHGFEPRTKIINCFIYCKIELKLVQIQALSYHYWTYNVKYPTVQGQRFRILVIGFEHVVINLIKFVYKLFHLVKELIPAIYHIRYLNK